MTADAGFKLSAETRTLKVLFAFYFVVLEMEPRALHELG